MLRGKVPLLYFGTAMRPEHNQTHGRPLPPKSEFLSHLKHRIAGSIDKIMSTPMIFGKMRRTVRLMLLSGLMLLSSGAVLPVQAAEAASRRPNIVFVLLDDVRFDDVIDHPFAKLPNFQRLVTEGASFQRMFTSAPLCSPSRAAILTGQYPHRNGITDNSERGEQSHRIVTFPKLLHDAGYRTGFFGKWHMSHADDSPRPGIDRWVSFVGQGFYFDADLNVDGQPVKSKGYITDTLTDHAVSFIESSSADRPFLAFIAQKASHPEIHPNQVRTFPAAPGDEKLYENETVPHGANWRAPLTGKPALARKVEFNDPRSPAGGLPDAFVKDRLRMLSAVDRSLGRLFDVLKAKGVLDDTLFAVTSDQGFFYGEFGLAQERRLAYEPSIHIPLIVRFPKLAAAGSKPAALASNVDLAPTLLELAGAKIPADMQGRSLVRAFKDNSATIRNEFLIEYYSDKEFSRLQGMGYHAVRTDRYKLIRYKELKGMDELYDLTKDPSELDNLLPDRAPAGVLEDLTARLDGMLGKPAGGAGQGPGI
jgi:arylsulfatase A-like enzyme